MAIKKISEKLIIATFIILAIFLIYFSFANQKLYGNDKESIEQVIRSIDGYENESIEIIEIKDMNNDRVVGFLSNNSPAYIQFSKNDSGNYEWKHIQKSTDESFSTFLIHLQKNESNVKKFMIVTNQENEIAKMKLGVNDQVIEQDFSVNQKSVSWIDLPEAEGEGFTFTYQYFNKEGNLISEK